MKRLGLKERSETQFGAIIDDFERKLLVKTLAKTGLGLIHAQPVVGDSVRWGSVSMIQGIEMKTLGTTSSVESTNGHLTDQTMRTNSFWTSLFLLAEMMFRKLRTFRELLEACF
jgi:hypothetical protein